MNSLPDPREYHQDDAPEPDIVAYYIFVTPVPGVAPEFWEHLIITKAFWPDGRVEDVAKMKARNYAEVELFVPPGLDKYFDNPEGLENFVERRA